MATIKPAAKGNAKKPATSSATAKKVDASSSKAPSTPTGKSGGAAKSR